MDGRGGAGLVVLPGLVGPAKLIPQPVRPPYRCAVGGADLFGLTPELDGLLLRQLKLEPNVSCRHSLGHGSVASFGGLRLRLLLIEKLHDIALAIALGDTTRGPSAVVADRRVSAAGQEQLSHIHVTVSRGSV